MGSVLEAKIGSGTAAKTGPTETGAGACPCTPSGAPLARRANVERIIKI